MFKHLAQPPATEFSYNVKGTAGANKIYYQTKGFITLHNIQNPIQLSITYDSGSSVTNATVCFNSFAGSYPISGINLNGTCPSGGIGIVSNATEVVLDSTKNIVKSSSSESFTAPIYVKPTNEGGFVAVLPENNQTTNFEVTISGLECEANLYPILSKNNGTYCKEIPDIDMDTEQTIQSLNPGEWTYYRFQSGVLNNSSNTIYLYLNDSSNGKIFAQSQYYPTASWFIPTYDEKLDNNILQSTILTPGLFNSSEEYFIGIQNIGSSAYSFLFNVTTVPCENFDVFGLNCAHNSGQNVDPSVGVYLYSARLTNPNSTSSDSSTSTTNTTINYGNALSFDYDDDSFDTDYAYFTIDDYPDYPTPYYIRVSVANNDVTDSDGAPPIYAKMGGYPSAQSNQYNVSSVGDVVHQITIRITADELRSPIDSTRTWYFAVPLPSDFSFWVGVNCAGNCDNQAYGICMCDTITCENATSNYSDPAAFYRLPSSTLDSGGACVCADDDYDSSFNCSEVNYPNFWIWITVLCIIATLVIAIGVGVPVICYLTNRKAKHATFEAIE